MEIRQVNCKTALSKSSLPGLDYSLNPYRGCQHKCAYCYVPNVLRIERNYWGCFVDAKINIPTVLAKELRNKKPGTIGISTVTDPYQPIESKLKLTRYCLEQILKYNFPVCIQTKSKLVTRDTDLISKLSDVEIMFSIGTLDDNERKILEPNASSINDRLNAMKKFSDEKIKTVVFFGPVYPTIKNEDLEKIIDTFVENGAKEVMVDKFNLRPGIFENIKKCNIPNFEKIRNQLYFKEMFNEMKKYGENRKIKVVSAF
ncbi:MAG: DNA photolyase [Euryarchaeota archaeon RBG_13_31_8]|nr:MAG: DNA photolyase [Euryarchaeota archaeon RBG_13_31_8]